MARSLIGPKIRERRRALGTTQASLAAKVGISASYLNLIEANKRNIGGALLKRIGEALGLALGELDGAVERRILGELAELSGEPLFSELRLSRASVDELASRHAAWGQALIVLHRAWRERDEAASALADRLSHDPFLGDAVHDMITRAAAIRSASEILETVADLTPAQRERFASIIGAESRRLADVAQAMRDFFERARIPTAASTPVEEVDDFLEEHGNYFEPLEDCAGRLRAQAGIGGDASAGALAAYLRRAHGIDADPGTNLEQARFALARRAAELFEGAAPAAALVQGAKGLTSEASRRRAGRALASYVAAAALMPYEDFRQEALECRYDVQRLALRFGTSFEQACHRLVTLRRPGAEGIPFGFMRVDAAGFVTKRFALPRLALPRHGGACPLWAVYQAFQSPGAVVRQLAAMPTGDRFLFVALAVDKGGGAFGMPRRLVSIMLACDALHADRTVYGDGIDFSSTAPAVPAGPNCRLCTRRDCAWREEDPIIDA